MMKYNTLQMLMATASTLLLIPVIASADAATCGALADASDERMQITAAHWVPAGPDADAKTDLPAYCAVTGIIDAHTGTADLPLGEEFDLRLPAEWNRRFYFQGGGGLDGRTRPAVGTSQPEGNDPALAKGYAVISTNGGHNYPDGSFGFDEEARKVWGYKVIEDVTLAGKALVKAYYGAAPDHSYLVGCSNGGRQGMMASQRYPDLFDGIVAGSPVFRMSRSHIDTAWGLQTLTAAAPKNEAGEPILSRAFSDADLGLLSQDILAACDAQDGLEDGLVSAVGQCDYDPSRLQCTGQKAEDCLSAAQVSAIASIHAGAHDSAGNTFYAPWPYDPGLSDPGWRKWRLGSSETAEPNAIKAGLSNNGIKHVFITPADPDFDIQTFDFDTDPQRMEASADFADAVSTDLDAFRDHGGKIILYQGAADPATSALDPARYYDALAERYGGVETAQDFARLYLVPGMGHCGGEGGLNSFDVLSAIVDWVEADKTPDMVVSGSYKPGAHRPMCAYPTSAVYDGAGDTDSADSFVCK